RNFGECGDAALKEPVIVTRNGRDRLVLLNIDEYNALRHAADMGDDLREATATDIKRGPELVRARRPRPARWWCSATESRRAQSLCCAMLTRRGQSARRARSLDSATLKPSAQSPAGRRNAFRLLLPAGSDLFRQRAAHPFSGPWTPPVDSMFSFCS